jgi:hypothetical protein
MPTNSASTYFSEDTVNDGVREKALGLSAFVPVPSSYGTKEPGSLGATRLDNDRVAVYPYERVIG